MTFGQRIKRQREKIGLTQQQLADTLEMKQEALSRLERDGVPNPGVKVLKRLAIALQCSTDYLVDRYDEYAVPEPVLADVS